MDVVQSSSVTDLPREEKVGRIGRIPVRNLWLLMLYASNLYREREIAGVDIEDNPDDIPDLVAEILCRKVEIRIRRNLNYRYQPRRAVLSRVRGRIDMLATGRRQLLDRGKVACRFDELTANTIRNRYVRAALERISKLVNRDGLTRRCQSLAADLMRLGVVGEKPSRNEVSIERFGRNDAVDQPMVAAARLAFDLALPTEDPGLRHLPSPEREETWVRKVFEKGIAGFYDVALSKEKWTVSAGRWFYWPVADSTPSMGKILPGMQTDIVLSHSAQKKRVVIDTKFAAILSPGRDGSPKLKSGYIYQIYAYLRSQEDNAKDPLAANASGLLLHPSIDGEVDESAVIQNHNIRFATVDLSASSTQIRERLLNIVR